MNIEKLIRRALLEKDLQQNQLAAMIAYSENGFSAYLKKGRFYVHDLERMADALGYGVKIQLIDHDTGKVIDCD